MPAYVADKVTGAAVPEPKFLRCRFFWPARRREPYSLDITSFSDSDASIAAIMMAAIAVRPMTYEPENSFNQPIMEGPAKPPIVPMLLMKASPPAAAAPVKKRVGMVQKIARAAVTPTKAALKPTSASA